MANIVGSNPNIYFWYVNSRNWFSPTSTPKNGVLYFGLEWENDYGNGIRSRGKNIHDIFLDRIDKEFNVNNNRKKLHWHKRDGSLRGSSAETVTAPMTYNAMMKYLGIMHEKGIASGTSRTRAGIHVHVNKSYFKSHHNIASCIYLVNKLEKFFYEISKRNLMSVRWCKFNKDISKEECFVATAKYSAVNNQHSRTIEFRIFRTESNAVDVAYIIKMVKLICEFCNKNDNVIDLEFTLLYSMWFKYLKENEDMLSDHYKKVLNKYYKYV